VVSADTSLTHLAGALGAPRWLALNPVPDWRWQLDRDGFALVSGRAPVPAGAGGGWAPVFARPMAAERPRRPFAPRARGNMALICESGASNAHPRPVAVRAGPDGLRVPPARAACNCRRRSSR
jgi:hypothetical protein